MELELELKNNSKFKFFSFKFVFTHKGYLKIGTAVIRQKDVNAFHREIAKVNIAQSLSCLEDNLVITDWKEISEEEYEYFNSLDRYKKSEKNSDEDNILHYNIITILSNSDNVGNKSVRIP